MKTRFALALGLVAAAATAWFARAADDEWKLPPEQTRLKSGPGVELVTAQCLLCHSVDYITTQPPLSRAQWQAALTKMQQKYGAPLPPTSTNALLDYLVGRYGRTQ